MEKVNLRDVISRVIFFPHHYSDKKDVIGQLQSRHRNVALLSQICTNITTLQSIFLTKRKVSKFVSLGHNQSQKTRKLANVNIAPKNKVMY